MLNHRFVNLGLSEQESTADRVRLLLEVGTGVLVIITANNLSGLLVDSLFRCWNEMPHHERHLVRKCCQHQQQYYHAQALVAKNSEY